MFVFIETKEELDWIENNKNILPENVCYLDLVTPIEERKYKSLTVKIK